LQGASRVVCFISDLEDRKVPNCNELNLEPSPSGRWPNYYLVVHNFSFRTPARTALFL